MAHTEILIIGAGVIGLAVAAELTREAKNRSVMIMERRERFGLEISSRNSEVIHAGLYYPAQSLKARLCVEGNALLYRFARRWKIPHLRLGKLVVANSPEGMDLLQPLFKQARQNGVLDVAYLDARQVARLEPSVRAEGALLSPSSGIIDSYRLMLILERLAAGQGVLPAYRHSVIGMEHTASGITVHYLNPDGSADRLECTWVINSAGLAAARVAAMAGVDVDSADYRVYMCKGEYFTLSGNKGRQVQRLIYPPPLKELQGLGVHLTRSLDGRVRLGPNAIYVEEEDYSVNPDHAPDFYHAVKEYLPFIEPADLEPEMAGIRPKLQGPGQPFRDFVIRHEADRGLPGLINLVGVESPGLTCCLSIARMVREMVEN